MRKILVIANREYQAAVRTKAFIITLLIMPIMMSGSLVLQWLFRDFKDTTDKHFVVVNHGAPEDLIETILARAQNYNDTQITDPSTGKQIKPRFQIDRVDKAAGPAEAIDVQRFELSEQVRSGILVGFLEIIAAKDENRSSSDARATAPPFVIRYATNRPTYMDFPKFVESVVSEAVRTRLAKRANLSEAQAKAFLQPVMLDAKGLTRRDASGKIEAPTEQSRFAPVIIPVILMILMFMVIMMTATPMMQSVVEEKIQRIAEVLLGSVPPFQLMMGKLIGMVGVSLTVAVVYLGGAYWAAHQFGFGELFGLHIVIWFVVFQTLACLMFGSLFIAIGAACTDMKETQNLLWPVMLLACFPLFLLGTIIQEPHSALARGLSYFPFATPTIMMVRLASPPGTGWWEPPLAIFLAVVTTVFCVYAAGRIFRIGILLQGKGAKLGQILKWVLHG
jgi:ABC-2 type transport system permease protein